MKTIVYQSYKPNNIPEWLSLCMSTVKSWAEFNDYDYKFIGDELFDVVPNDFKKNVNNLKLPQTDYARIVYAKQFLEKGYDRTLWIDADILIFDKEKFIIPEIYNYAFCKEIWIDKGRFNKIKSNFKVNNAVILFTNKPNVTDFFIDFSKKLVKDHQHWANRFMGSNSLKYKLIKKLNAGKPIPLREAIIGTIPLTNLYKVFKFDLLNNIGIISPLLYHDFKRKKTTHISIYKNIFQDSFFAVNMCGSFIGSNLYNTNLTEQLFFDVANELVKTKGLKFSN